MKHSGLNRRTLKKIDRYPTPQQLYLQITTNKWSYKIRKDFYELRDKALVSLLYLAMLRNSEAQRLTKSQFTLEKDRLKIEAVKLSKATRISKGKAVMRKQEFRPEIWIPLHGERGPLGKLVLDYLNILTKDDALFPIKNRRVHQIVTTLIGVPPHWERAFGENYLYDLWDKDILAVADYVSIDPGTLSLYVKRRHEKYKDREK
jgi:integrase